MIEVYKALPVEFKEIVRRDVATMIDPVGMSHHITKNDVIRLMHLRMHSTAQQCWYNALCPMTRSDLDAAGSGAGLEDSHTILSYWNELAMMFNNRDDGIIFYTYISFYNQ